MTLVLFFELSMIQSFWFPICALSLLPCITQSTATWLCLHSPSFSRSMWCVKRTPPSSPIPTASPSNLDSIGSSPLTAVSSFAVLLWNLQWLCTTSVFFNNLMQMYLRVFRGKSEGRAWSRYRGRKSSFFWWLHNRKQKNKTLKRRINQGHINEWVGIK